MTNRIPRITKLLAPYLTQEVKKDYFLLALTIFSLLLFGFWGIGPLLIRISSLHFELRSGKAYEAALTKKISALNEGKENLAKITTKTKAIDEAIPDDPAQAELIEELSIDGGKAEFSFTSIFLKGRGVGGGINAESFECSLQGSPEKLIHFLEELAKGRLIEIESILYSLRSARGGDILEMTLRGKSFYYERSE